MKAWYKVRTKSTGKAAPIINLTLRVELDAVVDADRLHQFQQAVGVLEDRKQLTPEATKKWLAAIADLRLFLSGLDGIRLASVVGLESEWVPLPGPTALEVAQEWLRVIENELVVSVSTGPGTYGIKMAIGKAEALFQLGASDIATVRAECRVMRDVIQDCKAKNTPPDAVRQTLEALVTTAKVTKDVTVCAVEVGVAVTSAGATAVAVGMVEALFGACSGAADAIQNAMDAAAKAEQERAQAKQECERLERVDVSHGGGAGGGAGGGGSLGRVGDVVQRRTL